MSAEGTDVGVVVIRGAGKDVKNGAKTEMTTGTKAPMTGDELNSAR